MTEPLAYRDTTTGPVTCTPQAIDALARTGGWTRFMGILGFITVGLMVVASLFMLLTGLARGEGTLIAMGCLYVVLACVYFYPMLLLNRYASRARDLKRDLLPGNLEEAAITMYAFWRYVGILAIAMIGLYLVVFIAALGIGVAGFFR